MARRDSPGAGSRRVVPAYAVTGGRTRSAGRDLPVETMVSTTSKGMGAAVDLRFERREIVLVSRRPQSVAELAARLRDGAALRLAGRSDQLSADAVVAVL